MQLRRWIRFVSLQGRSPAAWSVSRIVDASLFWLDLTTSSVFGFGDDDVGNELLVGRDLDFLGRGDGRGIRRDLGEFAGDDGGDSWGMGGDLGEFVGAPNGAGKILDDTRSRQKRQLPEGPK